MRKNGKKRDFLAILLVFLLILSLGAAGLSAYLEHAYQDCTSSEEALERLLDGIEAAANAGGAPAVEDFDVATYALWEGWEASFNAVLVDGEGEILAQTGELVCGDLSALNMMLARYERPIELPTVTDADGAIVHRTAYGRLGLLTGEDGQTIARFIADCDGEDVPLKTGSVSTTEYVHYFPSLDRELYARMTSEGYYEEQTATVSDEDIAEAEAYVRWENEELTQVGELRAEVRPLMGAFTGRTLIAFYLDNAGMRSMDAARMQIHIWAVEAVTWAIVLYAAFSLLLAVWVFRDARRCDFLPAMWGLLTLIGNVVAWLVYMLVRSRGMGSRCPRCGTALRGEFAYCPACGLQVHRSCASCGRAAEDAWKVCPYCGSELPESSKANANGALPEEKANF